MHFAALPARESFPSSRAQRGSSRLLQIVTLGVVLGAVVVILACCSGLVA